MIKNSTNLLITAFALIFFTGCSQAPRIYKVSGRPLIAKKIKSAIDDSRLVTNIGIRVASLKTGKTLYSLNSGQLYTPASNNKIFTSAAAFHYLGTDYRFKTGIWSDSADSEGNVNHLVLKGAGDPDFSLSSLDSIAQLIALSLKSVDTLIVDNTIHDSTRLGEGWMWDEGSGWYSAQIDGMSINDNCIDIVIAPGAAGEPPLVTVDPAVDYYSIENNASTVADTAGMEDFKLVRHWWEQNNKFTISGEILVEDEPDTLYRNIDSPALFAGAVLKHYLESYGVSMNGPVLIGKVNDTDSLLVQHESEPMTEIVNNFLKNSDNLSGELLIKTIGHETSGVQGNWENGLIAVRHFLQDYCQVDTTVMRMADGSGISRYNLTSPDQLSSVLEYVYSESGFRDEYLAAMPESGVDGTLEERMSGSEAASKIFAKTGTLSGVSCLSGYAFSRKGEPLVFSIMVNGYVGSSKPYRRLQDKICSILATH